MRLERFVVVAALLISACGQADDAGLRNDLRLESAASGLALVSAIAGHIIVIPFDGPERYLESEYHFPIVAFGKAGQMVLWWSPRGFLDLNGALVIDSVDGKRVAEVRPPISAFHPVALSETAERIAFWGTPQGKNTVKGLYWASFDFSRSGFVDQATGYPDWSPDGQALVYDKEGKIYLFEIARGSSRSLAAGHHPTWSPSGKWIAFVAPDGRASLMTTEGDRVNWPMSMHKPISALRWSPDGRLVGFSEELPSIFALFDAVSRLVVCRVSDGKAITVQMFNSKATDYQAYHWVADYRKFCSRCAAKEHTDNKSKR